MSIPALDQLPAADAPLAPRRFLGRRALLDPVCGRLRQAEMLSSELVGGPRSGKTSLLGYLASPQADEVLGSAQRMIRVYIDAAPLSAATSTPIQFWKQVFRELKAAAGAKELVAADPKIDEALNVATARIADGQLDLYDLQDVFDAFAAAQRPVVLLVDEFDTVIANPRYLPPAEFFNQVRNLCNRQPRGVAFIASASRPLSEVGGVAAGPSPFYNHFATVPMAPLSEDEIEALVAALAGLAAVSVDAGAWKLVAQVSGGQPMLASGLARKLIEAAAAGQPFGLAQCQAVFDDPDGPVARLMQSMLAMMSAVERQALQVATEHPDQLSENQTRLLQRLRKFALLPPGVEV